MDEPAAPPDPLRLGPPPCRPPASGRPACEVCGHPMEPEHAHHRCPACGYILPCCGW